MLGFGQAPIARGAAMPHAEAAAAVAVSPPRPPGALAATPSPIPAASARKATALARFAAIEAQLAAGPTPLPSSAARDLARISRRVAMDGVIVARLAALVAEASSDDDNSNAGDAGDAFAGAFGVARPLPRLQLLSAGWPSGPSAAPPDAALFGPGVAPPRWPDADVAAAAFAPDADAAAPSSRSSSAASLASSWASSLPAPKRRSVAAPAPATPTGRADADAASVFSGDPPRPPLASAASAGSFRGAASPASCGSWDALLDDASVAEREEFDRIFAMPFRAIEGGWSGASLDGGDDCEGGAGDGGGEHASSEGAAAEAVAAVAKGSQSPPSLSSPATAAAAAAAVSGNQKIPALSLRALAGAGGIAAAAAAVAAPAAGSGVRGRWALRRSAQPRTPLEAAADVASAFGGTLLTVVDALWRSVQEYVVPLGSAAAAATVVAGPFDRPPSITTALARHERVKSADHHQKRDATPLAGHGGMALAATSPRVTSLDVGNERLPLQRFVAGGAMLMNAAILWALFHRVSVSAVVNVVVGALQRTYFTAVA